MSSDLTELPVDLREAVERARAAARDAGTLHPPRVGRYTSPLTPEERNAVDATVREGAYAAAVAEISATDPDLASH